MVETADVLIVGGGVDGMATAYALAGRRAGCLMLLEQDGVDGLSLQTAGSGAGFKVSPAVGACMF